MDFEKLEKEAKEFVNEHGGTETLKKTAEELKGIVSSQGSDSDKLKQAEESIKDYLGHKQN